MAKRVSMMMLRDGAKGVNMDTSLDASPDSPHSDDRSVQGGEKDNDVKFSTGTAAEEAEATTTSLPPHVQQQNGIASPVHSSTDPDVSSSESDSESDRHMKKEPSESVSHTVIDSVKCDSQDTDVSGSSHYSESGSEDVIDLARGSASPSPSPSHVSLVMERLHISSDKGSSNYDTNSSTSSSEHNGTDSDTLDGGKQKQTDSGRHTNTSCEAKVQQVFSQLQDSLQGFLYGRQKELQDYLITITSSPRDYGIYVSKQLRPTPVDGVMRYRKDKEYCIVKTIHHSENSSCGVYLCRDIHTKQEFVLKKIMKYNHRLIGIEFLTQHSPCFLPKIYGVYKEKDFIYIFEEYVKGGTLLNCNWNLAEVRQFSEVLLSAFSYLHKRDLAHCDVKLMNLMVRDPSDTNSLVIIDFESAKHPQYHFQKGGHTVTYLPPWHEKILNLESYDPVLKTADLWAIACVIIFFLLPSDRRDLHGHVRGVWSKPMGDIQQDCVTCSVRNSHARKCCDDCKKKFLHFVKSHGHKILHIHLGHLMDSQIDDPNWKALREVLAYLTDPINIHEKHVDIALNIVKGTVHQPALRAIQY